MEKSLLVKELESLSNPGVVSRDGDSDDDEAVQLYNVDDDNGFQMETSLISEIKKKQITPLSSIDKR